MRRQDFHFELPEHLIAQRPAETRDGSKLMQVPIDGTPQIDVFESVLSAFKGDEVLVLNDTRVVPARVRGHKDSGGALELFFVENLGNGCIKAMLRGKRLRAGGRLVLPETDATILATGGDGVFEIQLHEVSDLWGWLERVGEVRPPISRIPDAIDSSRYQTVFVQEWQRQPHQPLAALHAQPLKALRIRACRSAR